ncbi:hypothetical protein [Streptococcus sp. A12]|uniref:hypothetical protein n=1 Tax=Streptococcus sp. A12 TaxID=1759399 RepID=UPI000F66D89D|nr:hypothetical protein [Streptococcus sp. A12]RSK03472.1 hypothetical protein D8782_09275 [Streptococcus sp. A12]
MTVEILSCNTEKGENPLGQQLANELNTTVKVSNEYLWFPSNGKLTPMGIKADRSQDTSKPVTMRSFTPQSKKISKEHANYGNTKKFLNFIFVINPFNIM